MRAVFAAAAALVLAAGCKTATFHDRVDYAILVDEVILPAEIAPGAPLPIGFEGTVGTTTCHRFLDHLTAATPNQLDIALRGRYEVRAGDRCVPTMVQLGGEHTYRHTAPMTDPFRVVVHQPDGSVLEFEVRVR